MLGVLSILRWQRQRRGPVCDVFLSFFLAYYGKKCVRSFVRVRAQERGSDKTALGPKIVLHCYNNALSLQFTLVFLQCCMRVSVHINNANIEGWAALYTCNIFFFWFS